MILDVEVDDGLVANGGFEEGKVAKRPTDLSFAKRLGGFYWCEKYFSAVDEKLYLCTRKSVESEVLSLIFRSICYHSYILGGYNRILSPV